MPTPAAEAPQIMSGGAAPIQEDTVEDAAAVAQHICDKASAEARAEVVAAYWHRLKDLRIPPAVRREFTTLEFYAHDDYWEDEE